MRTVKGRRNAKANQQITFDVFEQLISELNFPESVSAFRHFAKVRKNVKRRVTRKRVPALAPAVVT